MKRIHLLVSIFSVSLCAFSLTGCGQQSTTTAQNSVESESQAPATSVIESATDWSPTARTHLVSAPADSATLKIKFVIDGDVPEAGLIDGSRDPYCAELEMKDDRLIVGKDGAIQNIVVYLDKRKTKVDLPKFDAEAKKHVLDNKGCLFTPKIILSQPGDTIVVTNSDETGHNANFSFFNNQSVNFLVPSGQEKDLTLKADEPAPMPVECNVHPWMKAHIVVTDHPFVGATDKDGVLEIEDLPAGEITFKVWHEHQLKSLDKPIVDGKEEKWRGGRMEVELKPGMNDMGTIKLPAKLFKPMK
ncbi:MAG: methylamine utilization protein [Pirellulaceae bacterium]